MRTISFVVLALVASAAISQGVSPTGSKADNGNCNTGHCSACSLKADNTKICTTCIAMNINSAGEKCEGAVAGNCKTYGVLAGKAGCIGCDPAYINEQADASSLTTCNNKLATKVENCATSKKFGTADELCTSCKTGFSITKDKKCVANADAAKIANCEVSIDITASSTSTTPAAGLTLAAAQKLTCSQCAKGYYSKAGTDGIATCVKQGKDALGGLNCGVFTSDVCTSCDTAHGFFSSDVAYKDTTAKTNLYQICTKYVAIASFFVAAFVALLA